MKKIDLHVHTKANISKKEDDFEFSKESLVRYVSQNKLDIIAITNHNLFDNEQYMMVCDELQNKTNCIVLPGMELNIESSHLLVIGSEKNNIDLFNFSKEIENMKLQESGSIDFEKFIEILPSYKEFILIPHYHKNPIIKDTTLQKFGDAIKIGEVKSPKLFERIKKDVDKLVPVVFSDIRIKSEIDNFSIKNTYVDIENYEFNILKLALEDRNKVFISYNKNDSQFDITNCGISASNELNVVLGERSSGKTYTLNNIYNSYKSDSNIKYIKQFQLTSSSQEVEFDKILKNDNSEAIANDLIEIRQITEKILTLDEDYEKKVEEYVSSLLQYAKQYDLNDIFSNTKLYNESEYTILENNDLKELINSLEKVLSSKKYYEEISKFINLENIKALLLHFVELLKKEKLQNKMKEKVNYIIGDIKGRLHSMSSMPVVENIDFYDVARHNIMINEYDKVCNELKKEYIIKDEKIMNRFNIKVTRRAMKSTSEVKEVLKTKIPLSEAFSEYNKPYKYVCALKNANISINDIYKLLFYYDYSITNDKGNSLSGGEKAEYNLLKQIYDAKSYDMLLIDEPEASFDNLFIKNYIISLIKEISKKVPVVVSTHNNSLGMLLKPNIIIYTVNDNGKFDAYSCELGQSYLTNREGKNLQSYDVIMNIMEAGKMAYSERQGIYENFKN